LQDLITQTVTFENAFLWQRNPTIRAYIAILTTPLRFGIGGKDKDFLRNRQEKHEKMWKKLNFSDSGQKEASSWAKWYKLIRGSVRAPYFTLGLWNIVR